MSTILIIEDDADIQKIYDDLLTRKGFKVLSATSGSQGIHLVKTKKVNLILLDIMLPGGINGFDVLENLKQDDKLKDIPVIVLTNLESEKQVAMSIGVTDYLVKVNVNPQQLVAKIKQYLKS